MSDQNKNTKKLQIQLPFILFAISGVILVIVSVSILIPKYNRLNNIKGEIESKNQEITLSRANVKKMSEDLKKLESDENNDNSDEKKIIIPTEFNIPKLLETIDFYTHESKGYILTQLTFENPKPSAIDQNISMVHIVLDIETTPNKLIDLAKTLETEEQLFTIEKIDINEEARFLNDPVASKLEMTAYYNLSSNQ